MSKENKEGDREGYGGWKTNLALRFRTLTRYLIPSSLAYLSLPYVIFCAGWLKWYFALPCVGLILLSLLRCIQWTDQIVEGQQTHPDQSVLSLRGILLLFLVGLLLLGISGVGGYGYQDSDWLKHNAVLKDLIAQPWPIVYQFEGQDVPLVYYVAFYLPAAFLGKLGGWSLANQALFAWSLIGLILAMLWFLVLNRRAAFSVVLLFVVFSGLDVIGEQLVTPVVAALRPEVSEYLRWDHIEQWAIGWQYSSNTTLLFWVPNQALAGWIATGTFMYAFRYSSPKEYSLLYCGLTALWSPFVTLGLLPYLLAGFLLEDGVLLKRLKRYVSLSNLCGLVLLLVIGLFYSAKLYEVSPSLMDNIPHGFSLSFVDAEAKMIGLVLILTFCLLEFGLYGILICRSNQDRDVKAKALLVTTLVCLSLFPFYRYGTMNDFVMRASIPALFVLAVFLSRTLHSESLTGLKRVVMIMLVILGSATVLIELHRHTTEIHNAGTILQMPEGSQVADLWSYSTQMPDSDKGLGILLQYVGSSQAPFFRFMARH